jgi:hypothetical protein
VIAIMKQADIPIISQGIEKGHQCAGLFGELE